MSFRADVESKIVTQLFQPKQTENLARTYLETVFNTQHVLLMHRYFK